MTGGETDVFLVISNTNTTMNNDDQRQDNVKTAIHKCQH